MFTAKAFTVALLSMVGLATDCSKDYWPWEPEYEECKKPKANCRNHKDLVPKGKHHSAQIYDKYNCDALAATMKAGVYFGYDDELYLSLYIEMHGDYKLHKDFIVFTAGIDIDDAFSGRVDNSH